jgi:hypothetical protein
MLMFNSFFFCLLQTLNIQTKYAENKKKNLISTNYQNRLGKTIKNQNRLYVNRKKQQLLA